MKAQNMKEAYQVFVPNPLESLEELHNFYVKQESKSLEKLSFALLNSKYDQHTKWLVSGHRGNGKTTEFHLLMNKVQSSCFSIYADASTELDLNDIEPIDLLVLIGKRVYEEALKAHISIPKKVVQQLLERLVKFTGAPEPDKLNVEGSIEAKLNLALVEIGVQLSKAFGLRENLRTDLSSSYSELIQQFNELIECFAAEIEPRSLLVIVDSLDRITPEKALDIFYHSGALQSIACKAIYTPPLSIFYCHDFAQIRTGFGENSIAMPNIKTNTQTGKPHKQGRSILRQMILNRIEEQLIAPNALSRLIEVSGGLPRQLFVLAREACLYALMDQVEQIRLRHVSQSEIDSRNLLSNILTSEDYRELCAIYRGEKQPENTPQRDTLLHKLALFQYVNAKNWFNANPLLHPLLKERCDGPAQSGT